MPELRASEISGIQRTNNGCANWPWVPALGLSPSAGMTIRGSRYTLRSAGSSSSEMRRMLASAVESGMPAQCVRMTMWLTPNSFQ